MILKKIVNEGRAVQKPDIDLTDDEVKFFEEVKKLSPKFAPLKNNSFKTLYNIFDEDVVDNKTPENFVDWFDVSGGTFLDFVCDNYVRIPAGQGKPAKDALPIYVIRDLVVSEPSFAAALRKVATKWGILTKDGRLFGEISATPIDDEDLVEEMFLNVCSKGVKDPDRYNIPSIELSDKDRRSGELLKVLCDALRDAEAGNLNEDVEDSVEEIAEESVVEENPEETVENIEETETVEEEHPEAAEEAPEEEIPEDPNAYTGMLNTLVQKFWDLNNELNGAITTIEYYHKNSDKENLIAILNDIVDNNTINIGMLYKVMENVSSKVSDLLDQGAEKAETITEHPEE